MSLVALTGPAATRFAMVATASAVYTGSAPSLETLGYGTLRDPARSALWTTAHSRLLLGASTGPAYAKIPIVVGPEEDGYGRFVELHLEFSYSAGAGDTQPDFSMLYREAHGSDGASPPESNLQYDVGIWMGATILTWDIPEVLQGAPCGETVFVANTTNVSSASPMSVYFVSDNGLGGSETMITYLARALRFGVDNANGATTVHLSSLTYGTKLHAMIVFDDLADWAADMWLDPRDPGEEVVTGTGCRLREKICIEDVIDDISLSRQVSVYDAAVKLRVELKSAITGGLASGTHIVRLAITEGEASFADLGADATIVDAVTADVTLTDGVWEHETCDIAVGPLAPQVCVQASYEELTDSFCDSGIHAPSTSFTSRYAFRNGLSGAGPTGVKWNFADAYDAVNAETQIEGIFITEGSSGSTWTEEGIGQYYQPSVNNWRVDHRNLISFSNYGFSTNETFNAIELNIVMENASAGKVVIVPTTNTSFISLDAGLASPDVRVIDVQQGRKVYQIAPIDMSSYTRLQVYPLFDTTRAEWTTGPLNEALTRHEVQALTKKIRINTADTDIVLRYQ